MSLNRTDLRMLTQVIDACINGTKPRPDVAREYTEKELDDLRLRVRLAFAELGPEWGHKVLEWRFPLYRLHTLVRGKNKGKVRKKVLAPRLNEYASMQVFARAELYETLDFMILEATKAWPAAALVDHPRPRAVRVTRFSSRKPDEISVDSIGGKIPLDRLVQAGVLMGDNSKQLQREAIWFPALPTAGEMLIEVFELRATVVQENAPAPCNRPGA